MVRIAPPDAALAALSHPIRRRLVDRLTRGPARVTELATPFEMSLNGVSKHLKVLEAAGLVRRTRVGREHLLQLDARPLEAIHNWSGQYEKFWTKKLDALAQHLRDREDKS